MKVRRKSFSHFLPVIFLVALSSALVFSGRAGRASAGVDMELVIALDVSASVDAVEFNLMREGLARAILAPEVAAAISAGRHGAIAVSVVQWSGIAEQRIMIKWQRISGLPRITAFAKSIRQMARAFTEGSTDLAGAISFGTNLIMGTPYQSSRKVIDIAGDGTNNSNYTPNLQRDRAVLSGIIINGLAVTDGSRGLVDYYTRFVTGGDGSFVEATNNYAQFEQAMRRKLVREIGTLLLY